MYEAKLQNQLGNILQLTGDEANYQVVSITGLNPPEPTLNFSSLAGVNGQRYNSGKIKSREIVIEVRLNGYVEGNRLKLYEYSQSCEWVRFFYKTEKHNVFIDGIINGAESDYFTNSETVQIVIICPDPFFKAVGEYDFSSEQVRGLFTFPFSINIGEPIPFSEIISGDGELTVYNEGVSTGAVFTFRVRSQFNILLFKNVTTGQTMKLKKESFLEGDKIVINTNTGEKKLTLIRDLVQTNLASAIVLPVQFPELVRGNNLLQWQIDGQTGSRSVSLEVQFYHKYLAV